MRDLMLDIETLGTSPTSVITQIGACYFDRITGAVGDTFKMNIDIQDSIREGHVVDGDTLAWWFVQPRENASFLNEPKDKVKHTLMQFNEFASSAKQIWSHATFDFVLITHAMCMHNIKPSFRYTTARDIRTLMDLANIGKVECVAKKTHDGLDDCLFQVEYCTKAFNKLSK